MNILIELTEPQRIALIDFLLWLLAELNPQCSGITMTEREEDGND